ncbi:hypothetical protein CABS03_02729 [Colletotrichum abscissum]
MLNCIQTEHGGTRTRTRFPDDDTPQSPTHFGKLGEATMLTHRRQLLAESLYIIRSQSCMPSTRARRIIRGPGDKDDCVRCKPETHCAVRRGNCSSLIGGGSVNTQQMDDNIKAKVRKSHVPACPALRSLEPACQPPSPPPPPPPGGHTQRCLCIVLCVVRILSVRVACALPPDTGLLLFSSRFDDTAVQPPLLLFSSY